MSNVRRVAAGASGITGVLVAIVTFAGTEYSAGRRYAIDAKVERVRIEADITEQRAIEMLRVRHLARHDSLTDLPNRLLLFDRLETTIERNKRNGSRAEIETSFSHLPHAVHSGLP